MWYLYPARPVYCWADPSVANLKQLFYKHVLKWTSSAKIPIPLSGLSQKQANHDAKHLCVK